MNIQLDEYGGKSPVIRPMNASYKPTSADEFGACSDGSKRQDVFHRNLKTIAEYLGSNTIPVRFNIQGRGEFYLDRGCIKIAENAGVIRQFQNGPSGFVETIELINPNL